MDWSELLNWPEYSKRLAAIAIEFILDGIAGHFPDIVMIEH